MIFPTKKPDFSKTIGMVRYFDGTFRPSNDRSEAKLKALFLEVTGVEMRDTKIMPSTFGLYRAWAKKLGYRIMTSTKALLLLLAVAPLFVGCQSISRLTDGAPSPTIPTPAPIVGGGLQPLAPTAPDFNVPVPAGFTKVVFHDALPTTGVVQVRADAGSSVDVFMRQRAVGQWERLFPQYNEAFYYTFDAATGTVKIIGLHLDGIEFCVYQYVKA